MVEKLASELCLNAFQYLWFDTFVLLIFILYHFIIYSFILLSFILYHLLLTKCVTLSELCTVKPFLIALALILKSRLSKVISFHALICAINRKDTSISLDLKVIARQCPQIGRQ